MGSKHFQCLRISVERTLRSVIIIKQRRRHFGVHVVHLIFIYLFFCRFTLLFLISFAASRRFLCFFCFFFPIGVHRLYSLISSTNAMSHSQISLIVEGAYCEHFSLSPEFMLRALVFFFFSCSHFIRNNLVMGTFEMT